MSQNSASSDKEVSSITVTLLGTAQDGGRPQVGCQKACCATLKSEDARWPVSLGCLDGAGMGHLIDATRHLGEQLRLWQHPPLASVLLTHAHFGHVDGLGLLGRETMNCKGVALHISTSMAELIQSTPQWAIMVEQGVFDTKVFESGSGTAVKLGPGLVVQPVLVPHRAELSDMHAFVVRGPTRSLLYLPDHDTWAETLAAHGAASLREWFTALRIDIALLDGTFWSASELPPERQGRVPHPPVALSLEMLGPRLVEAGDPEVYFIHLNHTNPVHSEDSEEYQRVIELGWGVCSQGQQFVL